MSQKNLEILILVKVFTDPFYRQSYLKGPRPSFVKKTTVKILKLPISVGANEERAKCMGKDFSELYYNQQK